MYNSITLVFFVLFVGTYCLSIVLKNRHNLSYYNKNVIPNKNLKNVLHKFKVYHTGTFSSILCPCGQRLESNPLRIGIVAVICIVNVVICVQANNLLIDLYTSEHCSSRTRCVRHLFVDRIRLKRKGWHHACISQYNITHYIILR
jgi:hypothetical protein